MSSTVKLNRTGRRSREWRDHLEPNYLSRIQMLAFLRAFFNTGHESRPSKMTLIHGPPEKQDFPNPDDRFELIAELEKMKILSEDYQRKLQEAEHTGISWEKRARQEEDNVLSLKDEVRGLRLQALTYEKYAKKFQEEAKEFAQEAAQSKRARLVAEERTRRQDEILKENRHTENLVCTETKRLVFKLAKLQKSAECIDDDEVRKSMCQLYQNLEDWIKRHFPCILPTKDNGLPQILEVNPRSQVQTLHKIHGEVYALIFHAILQRFFVGIWDKPISRLFQNLDQEIIAHCPEHIWHHWRCATSNALFSLEGGELEQVCDYIVTVIESKIGARSKTDQGTRMAELQEVAWQFVEFKNELERQNEHYVFWWLIPGTPFDEEHMTSITGDIPSNGIIHIPLSPVLTKSRPLQKASTIVQKADVKLVAMATLAQDPAEIEEQL